MKQNQIRHILHTIYKLLKKNKRLIQITFLFFIIINIALNMYTARFANASEQLIGKGSSTDPYLISSLDDLILFRNLVNNGDSFSGKYVKQTSDIDMSPIKNWTPIGNMEQSNVFSGTYDGNGYQILNLKITNTEYPGLFGILEGMIRNVQLINCDISGEWAGGITSHSRNSPTIVNCIVTGTITATGRAGAIADNFSGGSIINCYTNCTLNADKHGAFAAYNASQITNCISEQDDIYPISMEGFMRNVYASSNLESCKSFFNSYISKNTSEISLTSNPSYHLWDIKDNQLLLDKETVFPKTFYAYIVFCIVCFASIVFFGIFLFRNAKKQSPAIVFCYLSISGHLLTLCALIVSHGEIWHTLLHKDKLDVAMDFFHSIEYTNGRSPYELYNTLYPPLANLLFYFLFRMVPSWQYNNWADTFKDGISFRGSTSDLRLWVPTFMLFIIFILIFSILFIYICQKIIAPQNHSFLIAFCGMFSYGMLFSYERGNIIVLCLIGSLAFLKYRNNERKWIAELALLALAISAGLKLYPAVYGIMILYDRKWKKAVKAIVYGAVIFILPVFAFREKLKGIPIFLSVLFNFGSKSSSQGLNIDGLSFDCCINNVLMVISNFTGLELNELLISGITSRLNLALALLVLASGFFLKKNWEKTLACSLALIGFQNQGRYILIFLLIPLFFFITEEKELTKENSLPFFAMCIGTLTLPITTNMSFFYLRFQLCIILLTLFLFKKSIGFAKKDPMVQKTIKTLKKQTAQGELEFLDIFTEN